MGTATNEKSNKNVVMDNDGNIIYAEDDNDDLEQPDGNDDWGLNELLLQLENDKNTYTTLEYTNEEIELLNNLKKQQQEGEEEEESEENNSFVIPLPKDEILKEKPHVQEIYNELVQTDNNTISDEQFWERYYIRCYIPSQQQQQSNEQESEEDEDEETPTNKMISNIFNFAKGAAKQLKEDVKEGHIRPPFVLNSAVDEEDDEDLGWDSDDDDDDDDDNNEDDTNEATSSLGLLLGTNTKEKEEEDNKYQEQINEITAQHQEKIIQLEEEREVLHQTIELQRNEITDLNAMIASLKEQLNKSIPDDTIKEQEDIDDDVQDSNNNDDDEPSSSSSTVLVTKNENDDVLVDNGVVQDDDKVDVEDKIDDNEKEEEEEDGWGDDAW